MNTNANLPTADMNIEDYEDKAVKRSKIAKGIGLAAGGVGIGLAANSAYGATIGGSDHVDVPIDAEEMAKGAEIGEDVEPVAEAPAQQAPQYIYIEKPAPAPVEEPEEATDLEWEETTNYFIDGEKVMSVEEGKLNGHDVMLIDSDADGHADILAYDANNNHIYEDDEIIELSASDNIHMGNDTAHVTDVHHDGYIFYDDTHEEELYVDNRDDTHQIHNNFEDEKTGEEYHGDFAEHNPDYNPNADLDYGHGNGYLAENYGYDSDDEYGNYHAGLQDVEMEDNVVSQPDMADATDMDDDSFDSMMESEEFLG